MRKTQQLVVTIASAVAAAISCSGCLALMVPGVAYSGYKYEHDKNQTAANTTRTRRAASRPPRRSRKKFLTAKSSSVAARRKCPS
jgi:hypothetical protein